MQQRQLELVLFENDAESARRHLACGIGAFLVDTEVMGKDLRQLGFDTEIRPGTWADLQGIAAIPGARSWCRLNRFGDHTGGEIEAALAAGAQVLLLPMVTQVREAQEFLDLVDGRCEAGIMMETVDGAALAPQLRPLALSCAFFGLNDFAISRGGGSIFRALVDGSVDAVRQALPDLRFGVGGLTDMRRGEPIPSFRLMQEIERLGCDFTFLRRSFRKDAREGSAAAIVEGIHEYWQHCRDRSESARRDDHQALVTLIRELEP